MVGRDVLCVKEGVQRGEVEVMGIAGWDRDMPAGWIIIVPYPSHLEIERKPFILRSLSIICRNMSAQDLP